MEKIDVINNIIDGNCKIDWLKAFDSRVKIKLNHKEEISEFSILTYLKEFFKNFDKLYYFIIYLIAPHYVSYNVNKIKKTLIDNASVTLNVWSWNKILNPKVINSDIFNYDNVDIITNASALSIKNNSIDVIINEQNLEHIYDFVWVVKDSHRVLKNNWTMYLTVPFVYWFHASPNDYHRFTHVWLKKLFEECWFDKVEVWIYSWPASWFLWILIEFLWVLLSFGSRTLYEIWTILFMIILWPIKFLDIILWKFKYSINIAWALYVIAKK